MRIATAAIAALVLVSTAVTVRSQVQPVARGETANSTAGGQIVTKTIAGQPALGVSPEFVIGAGDILQISVWQEPQFAETVEVRPDGKISLPLVSDVQIAGLTPSGAENKLTAKLQDFVKHPIVSVVVAEVHSRVVYVIGEVERPGSYPMTGNLNVEQLIAAAGGTTRRAKQKHVYVLHSGDSTRFPVNYAKVLQGKAPAQNIYLRPGDTIVVP
jgi:polysaccharide biosynthesis/export protein